MHPGEEAIRRLADPVDRTRDDLVRAALRHREADVPLELGDLIVVDIEARREAEALREREPADERARGKARRLEPRGERGGAVLDAKPAVVAHAMLVRQPAGEDGRVRRKRHDRVRVREGKPRAARGQPVEVRRLRAPAVRRKRVRAQCVDGDEQDVLIGVRLDEKRASSRPQEHDGRDDDEHCCADQPPERRATSPGSGCRADGFPGLFAVTGAVRATITPAAHAARAAGAGHDDHDGTTAFAKATAVRRSFTRRRMDTMSRLSFRHS